MHCLPSPLTSPSHTFFSVAIIPHTLHYTPPLTFPHPYWTLPHLPSFIAATSDSPPHVPYTTRIPDPASLPLTSFPYIYLSLPTIHPRHYTPPFLTHYIILSYILPLHLPLTSHHTPQTLHASMPHPLHHPPTHSSSTLASHSPSYTPHTTTSPFLTYVTLPHLLPLQLPRTLHPTPHTLYHLHSPPPRATSPSQTSFPY